MGISNFFHKLKLAKDVIVKQNFSEIFQLYNQGEPPKRGNKQLLQEYNNLPWLRATVNKVSKSVASNSWQLYTVNQNNQNQRMKDIKNLKRLNLGDRKNKINQLKRDEEIEEITDHPFLDLIHDMNPQMVGLVGRQLIQMYLDLAGESFVLIERNGMGKPAELWPLPPTAVTELATVEDPKFTVNFGGFYGEVPAEDMIFFKDPDPANPYGRGSGLSKSLGDELQTDEYAAKHTKAWFYNKARPDILVTAEGLEKGDTERLENDWKSKLQGFRDAYRTHFLNKDVDVHQLNQTFENMQLVELREFERDTIRQVFGVAPEIMGIIETSNRATIEAADTLYGKHVLIPRLELLREVLQVKLVDQYDQKLILDYSNPVPEDKEYKKEIMSNAPWAFKVDEHRKVAEHEPLPEDQGQKFYVPANLISVDASTSENNNPDNGGNDDEEEEDEKVLTIKSENKNKSKVIKQDEVDPSIIDEALSVISTSQLSDETKEQYINILMSRGQDALDDLDVDISFNLDTPELRFYKDNVTNDMYRNINATTKEQLRNALQEGIENGEGIPNLANRVSDVYDEAKGNRAKLIARTESMRTVNFSTFQAYKQSNVVKKKEWIATPDSRVREGHMNLDFRTRSDPIKLNADFILKRGPNVGARAPSPGMFGIQAEDLNCRCTIAPVTNNKSNYDDEDRRLSYWKFMDRQARGFQAAMKAAYQRAFQKQQLAVMNVLKNWNDEDEE